MCVVENSRVCNYDKMLKNVIVGITCEVELCCVRTGLIYDLSSHS